MIDLQVIIGTLKFLNEKLIFNVFTRLCSFRVHWRAQDDIILLADSNNWEESHLVSEKYQSFKQISRKRRVFKVS